MSVRAGTTASGIRVPCYHDICEHEPACPPLTASAAREWLVPHLRRALSLVESAESLDGPEFDAALSELEGVDEVLLDIVHPDDETPVERRQKELAETKRIVLDSPYSWLLNRISDHAQRIVGGLLGQPALRGQMSGMWLGMLLRDIALLMRRADKGAWWDYLNDCPSEHPPSALGTSHDDTALAMYRAMRDAMLAERPWEVAS